MNNDTLKKRQDMSLEEINEIIHEVRYGIDEPNEETIAAIEEARNGINLEPFNLEDLEKLINSSD